MSETVRPPRPEPGDVTRRVIRLRICKACRCMVGSSGLCDCGCGHDGDARNPQNTFVAVYDRVDTFIGDEELR